MSMHLCGPQLTTLNTKKRKKKKTKKQEEAELKYQKFLKSKGYDPEKRKNKNKTKVAPRQTSKLPEASKESIVGVAAKSTPNVYSGKRKLLGIATMHKSNMVPVFSEEDARSLATMRRG